MQRTEHDFDLYWFALEIPWEEKRSQLRPTTSHSTKSAFLKSLHFETYVLNRERDWARHYDTKETYTTAAQTLTATEQQAAPKTQGYNLWLKLCSKCACDVV